MWQQPTTPPLGGLSVDNVLITNVTSGQIVLTLDPSYADQNVNDWVTVGSNGNCINVCLNAGTTVPPSSPPYPHFGHVKAVLGSYSITNAQLLLLLIVVVAIVAWIK